MDWILSIFIKIHIRIFHGYGFEIQIPIFLMDTNVDTVFISELGTNTDLHNHPDPNFF
jgi:hypothetical protein